MKTDRETAERMVRQNKMSGFYHHSYKQGKRDIQDLLDGNEGNFPAYDKYIDVLGPEPLRARKNNGICFITVICRAAIERGVELEMSFSLSDYYITLIEQMKDHGAVAEVVQAAKDHYVQLVREHRSSTLSPILLRSTQYITAICMNGSR